ncbi:MAG: SPOR domain-containing protein [Thermodesulfobacteriota bacterium]
MTNKGLVALGIGVVSIILLAALYFFWPASRPPSAPEKPEIKSQAVPGEKPGPAEPAAPTPPEKVPPTPAEEAAPGEKPGAKPEVGAAAPKEAAPPPPEEVEKYGFLAASYRRYRDAGKRLQKLREQGQPGFIRKEKGRYQVWVGPFDTSPEAEAAAKALRKKFKVSPKIQKVIIPPPK